MKVLETNHLKNRYYMVAENDVKVVIDERTRQWGAAVTLFIKNVGTEFAEADVAGKMWALPPGEWRRFIVLPGPVKDMVVVCDRYIPVKEMGG